MELGKDVPVLFAFLNYFSDTFMVYSAAGNQIYAWRRGCELKHVYKGHENAVKLLLPFGPHLVSIDEKSQLKVFDIKAEKSKNVSRILLKWKDSSTQCSKKLP